MWDLASGGMTMLSSSGRRRAGQRGRSGELRRAGHREGDTAHRFAAAGARRTSPAVSTGGTRRLHGFDDFWEPFTYAVGPSGQASPRPPEQQARVCDACREALPEGPFTLDARAWYATGTVAKS